MATITEFNQFAEDLPHGVHDLSSDQLTVALCASANAPVATNSVLADLTEISYTNLSSRNLTVSTSEGSDGTYEAVVDDLVLSASGGSVAAFRYIVIYNNTPTSPTDPLIGFYDYGSALTLADGDSLTLNFGANWFTL